MQSTFQEASPITPPRNVYDASLPTSTRKISASFTRDGPQSSHPTTAYSSVTASTSRFEALYDHPGPLTSHPTTAYTSAVTAASTHDKTDKQRWGLSASHTISNIPVHAMYWKDVQAKRDELQTRRRASPTNIPLPKPSTATTYTTAIGQHAQILPENIPPSSSASSISTKHKDSLDMNAAQRAIFKPAPKRKTKSRSGIPKSKTLNVFSNITSSLSRASLVSFTRNESRHTSVSSTATGNSTVTALSLGGDTSRVTSSSSARQAMPPPPTPTPKISYPSNPRQIHSGQPSAYWTGRFMALQDRFHSEMLLPLNMNTMISAHAEHTQIPLTPPVPQTALAISSTTACITSTPHKPTLSPRKKTPCSSPRKPKPRKLSPQKKKVPTKQPTVKSTLAPSSTTTAISHPRLQAAGSSSRNQASMLHSVTEAAALLSDEDNRAKRIFLHLEAMCMTSEARKSLHEWQQAYARSVGKECLLPKGGSMGSEEHKDREKGWVGRLFSGGGVGGGMKRGGFIEL
ncbi:hypothetical protein F4778DRAFT_799840 [Xylariomycetidae sp. FL2044]|nr:hypothetical protein F4778DRAFT_799840 [Xylariomycetidae sp. FL2044]